MIISKTIMELKTDKRGQTNVLVKTLQESGKPNTQDLANMLKAHFEAIGFTQVQTADTGNKFATRISIWYTSPHNVLEYIEYGVDVFKGNVEFIPRIIVTRKIDSQTITINEHHAPSTSELQFALSCLFSGYGEFVDTDGDFVAHQKGNDTTKCISVKPFKLVSMRIAEYEHLP